MEIADDGESAPVSPAVVAACDDARAAALVPGASVNSFHGPLDDELLPAGATGCGISVTGSFSRLGRSRPPAEILAEHFRRPGWREETAYSADGPDGTSSAYRGDGAACILRGARGTWNADRTSKVRAKDRYDVRVVCTRSLPGKPKRSRD